MQDRWGQQDQQDDHRHHQHHDHHHQLDRSSQTGVVTVAGSPKCELSRVPRAKAEYDGFANPEGQAVGSYLVLLLSAGLALDDCARLTNQLRRQMKSILMNRLLTASPFAMRGQQSPKKESGSPEVAPKSPVRLCLRSPGRTRTDDQVVHTGIRRGDRRHDYHSKEPNELG